MQAKHMKAKRRSQRAQFIAKILTLLHTPDYDPPLFVLPSRTISLYL